MVLVLTPRECILKPQIGQKCVSGRVSNVRIFFVPKIAGIKIGNVIYGFIYMGKFIVEHTIMNKVTGILLFLLPLTVFFVEMKYSAMAVCSIAKFSAVQEGYYIKEGREIV